MELRQTWGGKSVIGNKFALEMNKQNLSGISAMRLRTFKILYLKLFKNLTFWD